MIYREYLVMRNALAWFAVMLPAIILIGLISGAIHIGPIETDDAGIDVASGSGWLAAIFASIFGVALGNGSREAARVLWVLPAARWKLALQVIAVDLAGTTVAFAYTYAVIHSFLAFAHRDFGAQMFGTFNTAGVLMALAMAYATYGWCALAGMLGRRVPYCGIIALPALTIWMNLAQFPILRAAAITNPFVVFNSALTLKSWEHHRFALDPTTATLQWLGTVWETPVLVAIAFATCGLAIALWQRAEAID